jgi:hypothetical protein
LEKRLPQIIDTLAGSEPRAPRKDRLAAFI